MRKYLVSLGLVCILSAGSFGAPLSQVFDINRGSYVGSWLGDAIYKIDAPTSIETQASRLFYGGGFSLRVPNKTFRPFQIQPPSFSFGCGGIDFTFGSYGYFDAEYLVEFGKAIIENAPAFSFKTAIEIFCPTCEDILTKLEQTANLVNSMQLDSCRFSQAVSDWTKDKLLSTIASKEAEQGKKVFYMKSVETLNKNAKTLMNLFVDKGLERSQVVRIINDLSLSKDPISIIDHVIPRLDDENSIGGSKLSEYPIVIRNPSCMQYRPVK